MLDLLSSFYSTFCPADIQSLAGLYQDTNVVCIICRNIVKCAFSCELYKSKNLFFFSAKIDKYFFWMVVRPAVSGSVEDELGDLIVQVFGAKGFGNDFHESFSHEVDPHVFVYCCRKSDGRH
jgi:hypothetical protein